MISQLLQLSQLGSGTTTSALGATGTTDALSGTTLDAAHAREPRRERLDSPPSRASDRGDRFHDCARERRDLDHERHDAGVPVERARAAGQAVRVRRDRADQRPEPARVRLLRAHEVGRGPRRRPDPRRRDRAVPLHPRPRRHDDRAAGPAHAGRAAVPLLATSPRTSATSPPTATSRSASATACTRSRPAATRTARTCSTTPSGRDFNFAGMIPGMT